MNLNDTLLGSFLPGVDISAVLRELPLPRPVCCDSSLCSLLKDFDGKDDFGKPKDFLEPEIMEELAHHLRSVKLVDIEFTETTVPSSSEKSVSKCLTFLTNLNIFVNPPFKPQDEIQVGKQLDDPDNATLVETCCSSPLQETDREEESFDSSVPHAGDAPTDCSSLEYLATAPSKEILFSDDSNEQHFQVTPIVERITDEHTTEHSLSVSAQNLNSKNGHPMIINLDTPVVALRRLSSHDISLAKKSVKKFQMELKSPPRLRGNFFNTTSDDHDYLRSVNHKDKFFKSMELNARNSNEVGNNMGDPVTGQNIINDSCLPIGKRSLSEINSVAAYEPYHKETEFQKHTVRVKKSKRRKEMMLEDSGSFECFSEIIEDVLNLAENAETTCFDGEIIPYIPETLLSVPKLQQLCDEAAKMKKLNLMQKFPAESLVRLIAVLNQNIDRLSLNMSNELCLIEKIEEVSMRNVLSSLSMLYIMTSQNMSEKIFLDEVIENITQLFKDQLNDIIFPAFDVAYRQESKRKFTKKQNKDSNFQKMKKPVRDLYHKLQETIDLVTDLLEIKKLTDSVVLNLTSGGIVTFFVDGVRDLQLKSLRMITNIFTQYEEHRELILNNLLDSVVKLPTSKRNIRNYRLHRENENIQIFTALVLQLIHSVVKLPEEECTCAGIQDKPNVISECSHQEVDEKLITFSYDASMKVSYQFLAVFLRRYARKNAVMDYRPLFENFLEDLLRTLNKPEWPGSEILLFTLSKILVHDLRQKSTELFLKNACLDYLASITARVRKGIIAVKEEEGVMSKVIHRMLAEDNHHTEAMNSKRKNAYSVESRQKLVLQKALLNFLDCSIRNDPSWQFAKHFYIAQWYYDETRANDKIGDVSDSNSKDKAEDVNQREEGTSDVGYHDGKTGELKSLNQSPGANLTTIQCFLKDYLKEDFRKVNLKTKPVDYETAELISRYLGSKRDLFIFSDEYLKQILLNLGETVVSVRNKAMKCLASIVDVDSSIFSREDVQKTVHCRLLDHAIAVREAAVDLVGRCLLQRPELLNSYYEMFTNRILDTGISVRKRVIKVLKSICLEHPDLPEVPDICLKILRRVNDEDGIRKLVLEFFCCLWFTSIDRDSDAKVDSIINVVANCANAELFEVLLSEFLKNKDNGNSEIIAKSCKSIVDRVVEKLLQLDKSDTSSEVFQLNSCFATLLSFCKIFPKCVVPYVTTIQPYLLLKCTVQSDFPVLIRVAHIMKLVVPLMEHPNETFLTRLEESLINLILCQHVTVIPSCVDCLSTIVTQVTHNYQLVKDCFNRSFQILLAFHKIYTSTLSNDIKLKCHRSKLLRVLYTVGLFCQHFNFDDISDDSGSNATVSSRDQIFHVFLYFSNYNVEIIRLRALEGLGNILLRQSDFMHKPVVENLYQDVLQSSTDASSFKKQVLGNIDNYLAEVERQMIEHEAKSGSSNAGNLKELGNAAFDSASKIAQVYLKLVLECSLHRDGEVRKKAMRVIRHILNQGFVIPARLISHLVCLGTDVDPIVRNISHELLKSISQKEPSSIPNDAVIGIRKSFNMQKSLLNNGVLRGFREHENYVSFCDFVYSLISSKKDTKRAFLNSMLKIFEDTDVSLTELLYIADNLVYFPYDVMDDLFLIMEKIDSYISNNAEELLQLFNKLLVKQHETIDDENEHDSGEDEDFESIYQSLPSDIVPLQKCVADVQKCVLLLNLKQSLKDMYSLETKMKARQSNASDITKLTRRKILFEPTTVINFIATEFSEENAIEQRKRIVDEYVHFKMLLANVDCEKQIKFSNNLDDNVSRVQECLSVISSPHRKDANGTVLVRRRSSRKRNKKS